MVEFKKRQDLDTFYDIHIRPLNPSGEHEKSLRDFITQVRHEKIKSVEDIKKMAKSYKSYVDEWNNVYGSADQVYISKENRLKSFGDFYAAGMFKSKSFSKMDSRYIYMFGQIEYGEIEKLHKEFEKRTTSPWTD